MQNGRKGLSALGLENLRAARRRGSSRRRRPMPAAAAPPPPADHHASVALRTPAATWVESLGHAAKRRAPGHELVEALLGLLSDSDPLAAGLLAEPRDAAGRRAFLLFGRRPDFELGQRPENHDLVILDRDLHSREPAVREPTGKPTLIVPNSFSSIITKLRCNRPVVKPGSVSSQSDGDDAGRRAVDDSLAARAPPEA